jgi:hypothetical protein
MRSRVLGAAIKIFCPPLSHWLRCASNQGPVDDDPRAIRTFGHSNVRPIWMFAINDVRHKTILRHK